MFKSELLWRKDLAVTYISFASYYYFFLGQAFANANFNFVPCSKHYKINNYLLNKLLWLLLDNNFQKLSTTIN